MVREPFMAKTVTIQIGNIIRKDIDEIATKDYTSIISLSTLVQEEIVRRKIRKVQ